MELVRGSCIFCTINSKVVAPSYVEPHIKVVGTLLSHKLRVKTLLNIKPDFKVCPLCIYDINGAEKQHSLILKAKGAPHIKKCMLCKCDEIILKPPNSIIPNIEAVMADFKHIQDVNNSVICINCYKYVDVMNNLYSKLIYKHPSLLPKQISGSTNSARPLSARKNKGVLVTIELSDDETDKYRKYAQTNPLNMSLKHLKPLKNSTLISHDCIKDDFKFFCQIPYVNLVCENLMKIRLTNGKLRKEHENKNSFINKVIKNKPFFKIKMKKPKKQVETTKSSSRESKVKKNPAKELYVKLSQYDISNHQSYDLYKNNSAKYITPTKANIMENYETFSSSAKRKSVSFAEYKNIEIAYEEYTPKKLCDESDEKKLRPMLKKLPLNDSDSEGSNSATQNDSSDDLLNEDKAKSNSVGRGTPKLLSKKIKHSDKSNKCKRIKRKVDGDCESSTDEENPSVSKKLKPLSKSKMQLNKNSLDELNVKERSDDSGIGNLQSNISKTAQNKCNDGYSSDEEVLENIYKNKNDTFDFDTIIKNTQDSLFDRLLNDRPLTPEKSDESRKQITKTSKRVKNNWSSDEDDEQLQDISSKERSEDQLNDKQSEEDKSEGQLDDNNQSKEDTSNKEENKNNKHVENQDTDEETKEENIDKINGIKHLNTCQEHNNVNDEQPIKETSDEDENKNREESDKSDEKQNIDEEVIASGKNESTVESGTDDSTTSISRQTEKDEDILEDTVQNTAETNENEINDSDEGLSNSEDTLSPEKFKLAVSPDSE